MLYNIFWTLHNCNVEVGRFAPCRPAPLARRGSTVLAALARCYHGDLATLPPAPPGGLAELARPPTNEFDKQHDLY